MTRSTTAASGKTDATGTRVLRLLLIYLRPHWATLLAGFVALVFSSASLFAVGIGLSRLADLITTDRRATGGLSFDRMVLIAYGVMCCYAIGLFFRDYLMRKVGQRVSLHFRRDVYRNLLELDPTFYDANSHSEVQTRLVADTQEMERLIGQFVPNMVHSTLLLIAAGGYAVYLNPPLSLIIAMSIPLILLPGGLLSGPMAKLADRRQGALALAGSYAAEILRNLKLMQSFGQQRRSADQYDTLLRDGYALALRSARLEIALTATTSFLAYAVLALIIWYAGRDVLAGKSPAGDLVGYIFYANLATTAVASIITQWASMRGASGAASRLLELRGERSRLVRGQPEQPTMPARLIDPRGVELILRDVGFSYPAHPGRPVIQDFCLHVGPGEMVAVVGPSGSGKSTLFDLLQGFYSASHGRIEIDGADIAAVPFDHLAAGSALVPQRPELLSGKVIDNIRVGRADASEEEIWTALRRADADGFVRAMPDGLMTELGHDAGRLSGGQRQRLSIARALVRRPRLLLFDEPTSALDVESEAGLQQTLRSLKGDQTIILITHSLGIAACADRVALIIHGKLIALGSHEELQRTSPEYAALVRLAFLSGDRETANSSQVRPEDESESNEFAGSI